MRKLIGLFVSTAMVGTQLLAAAPGLATPDAGAARTRYAEQRAGGNARPAKPAYAKPPTAQMPARQKPARPDRPSYAAPTTRPNRPSAANAPGRPNVPSYAKPAQRPQVPSYSTPGSHLKPAQGGKKPGQGNRPGTNRPNKPNRPSGGNNDININHNNNININANNRYPVYRPPGGGYYRPPNGGYYGPPRPPYGGWHGGYYPPRRYYYNDGPSVGGVLFGVAVTTSLLALLSAANQPDVVYVQGQAPAPLPPYVPPSNASGAPAIINVDISSMASAARSSASVCLTEAARQVGATGGTEIRVDQISEVEQGNGGYRFRLTLLADYSTGTRAIPMYCRATPDKIVELTFG